MKGRSVCETSSTGAHAIADGVTTATRAALLYKPPVAQELPPGFPATAIARHHRPLLAAVPIPAAALPEQGHLTVFGCFQVVRRRSTPVRASHCGNILV